MEMAGREEIDEETGDEDTSGDETEVKKPKVTVQVSTCVQPSTIQFLITCSMQKMQGEGLVYFIT